MNEEQIKQEITNLKEKINYHAQKYYDEDTSEISDFEYDMLVVELKNLEKEYPNLVEKQSRADKIGGKVKEGFTKVTHKVSLQSLQDVFSYEELRAFLEKCRGRRPRQP